MRICGAEHLHPPIIVEEHMQHVIKMKSFISLIEQLHDAKLQEGFVQQGGAIAH